MCCGIMVVRLVGGALLWDNGCEVGGRGFAVGYYLGAGSITPCVSIDCVFASG